MGVRSQRYSMLVVDGVVKTLNIEAPGKFEVSDAETMLEQVQHGSTGLKQLSCSVEAVDDALNARRVHNPSFAGIQLRPYGACDQSRI